MNGQSGTHIKRPIVDVLLASKKLWQVTFSQVFSSDMKSGSFSVAGALGRRESTR
jgi:hypothetical protein